MMYMKDFDGKEVVIIGGGLAADMFVLERTKRRGAIVVCINDHFNRSWASPNVIFHSADKPLEFHPKLKNTLTHFFFDITAPLAADVNLTLANQLPSVERLAYANQTYGRENPYGPAFEWLPTLNRHLGTKAFTGIVALEFFSRLNVERIDLTGFDFYTRGTLPQSVQRLDGKRIRARGPHQIWPQIVYMREKYLSDPRIFIDDVLTKIIC